jgi:hypothetical protein
LTRRNDLQGMHRGHNGRCRLHQLQLSQHPQLQVRKARAFPGPPTVRRHSDTPHNRQVNWHHVVKADELSVLHGTAVQSGDFKSNTLLPERCRSQLYKATPVG